jgi:neutral ceramidase
MRVEFCIGSMTSLRLLFCFVVLTASLHAQNGSVRAGAAAVEIPADDSMVIGGGILGRYVKGQEGKLRATAVVLSREGTAEPLAMVACDLLMSERDILDAACAEITKRCAIPASHVLINATHTHSAPSSCTVHGYPRDEKFVQSAKEAIIDAVSQAHARCMESTPGTLEFCLGEESSVGRNSRILFDDGTIMWTGDKTGLLRPTGPFDPQLPVLAFRKPDRSLTALIFGHSTHTIGTVKGAVRSPSFYGLAAQELEQELGGTALFVEGASGSTHNLDLTAAECLLRVKAAVHEALRKTAPVPVKRLAALKREIEVKVRTFDEAADDKAVSDYCNRRLDPKVAPTTIEVFRTMRKNLAPRQGEVRKTWVQAMVIGDIAWVGVPAEFFTVLGQDIKRRSPYRHTFIAELANDWIGYVGNAEAYDLGGYQTWTGYHSWVERGTGEKIVDAAVALLEELHTGGKATVRSEK